MLPWRTLGLDKFRDNWGNLYTYRADIAYTHALIGFDENTRADVFDPRLVMEPALTRADKLVYRRRVITDLSAVSNNFGVTVTTALLTVTLINRQEPSLICDVGTNNPAACYRSNVAGYVNLSLRAGEVVQAEGTPPRPYTVGDIFQGAPIVIVSHGPNGHGAISRSTWLTKELPICTYPIHPAKGVSAVEDRFLLEASNFAHENRRGDCSISNTASGNMPQFAFAIAPRKQRGTTYEFDDIVDWLDQEEVVQLLTKASVLPADNLPLLQYP